MNNVTRLNLIAKLREESGGKTLKTKRIVYWSELDDSFLAEMPELPGCISDGKTPIEAIKNLEVIAREWIELAEELDAGLEKGYADMLAGRTRPVEEVFAELQKDYNI